MLGCTAARSAESTYLRVFHQKRRFRDSVLLDDLKPATSKNAKAHCIDWTTKSSLVPLTHGQFLMIVPERNATSVISFKDNR